MPDVVLAAPNPETLHLVLELSAGVIGVTFGIIAYLVVRAINRVDTSLNELRTDIKGLVKDDTEVKVKLKEIEVRVTAIEADILVLKKAA